MIQCMHMNEPTPKGDVLAGLPKKNQATVLGTVLGKDVNGQADPTRLKVAKEFLEENPGYTETFLKAAGESQNTDPDQEEKK